jgi:hypothetical protein
MGDDLSPPMRQALAEAMVDPHALDPGRINSKNTRDALIRRDLVRLVDGQWRLTLEGIEAARWHQ